jgi:hypothetical protein
MNSAVRQLLLTERRLFFADVRTDMTIEIMETK